jgi:archaemetzincin
VEVVPLGRVDPVALEVAAANLQAILGLGADILEAWPEPDYALLRERGQYNAGPILKALAEGRNGPPIRMGLTRLDLCLPILTFVYGEAQMGGQAAVVSYHRLGEERPGEIILPALLYERLAKVVVHEAAHVLGLSHCRAPACLMRFSQSLEQLDGLELLFCDQCQYELERRREILRRGGPSGT